VSGSSLLPYVNVVVDGPFLEEEKDLSLSFRGSRNQRIIPLEKGKPVWKQRT
jgi:anaerobic ribonucleoside-triphosphate reductase activating protein